MSDSGGSPRGLDGLPSRSRSVSSRRWVLLGLACAETITLVVLFGNLVSPHHDPDLARMIGPIHGCLYATGVVLTLAGPFSRKTKLVAVLPLIGIWSATVIAMRRHRQRTRM